MKNNFKINLSLIIIGLILFSCNPIKRLDALFIQNPTEASRLSNEIYPCFTGKLRSDTLIKHDTSIIAGNTITNTVLRHDTVFITKTITLPGHTITNTVTIRDTIPDNRALSACTLSAQQANSDNLKAQQKLSDTEHGRNLWMWTAIGAIFLIVVFLVVKVYAFFSGGAVTGIIKKI
jgi:hypothetical protein